MLPLARVRLSCFLVAYGLCAALQCSAQTPGDRRAGVVPPTALTTPTNFGSVAGHVYFAGNNLPVRFAQVALQPIDVASSSAPTPGKKEMPNFQVYQTDLAGAFLIDHVPPGTYYVVVKYPGCLSPFAAFTQSELEKPTIEQAKAISAAIPTVSVSANNTVSVSVPLAQGAGLSGTVRFDDGTSFANGLLSVEKHGPDRKWASPRATEGYSTADIGGRWQIGGLPAGEYRVKVLLRIEERHQSSLLSDEVSSWNNTTFSVPVYLGDTERERDAKTVTLTDNQLAANQDITVPIAKMHTVTGALVDARTGQALNAGHVDLIDAEDGTKITSAAIDPQTRSFSLPFVFEGTYKLATKDAHEARIESIPLAEGSFGTPQNKETPLRQYVPGEMPLIVAGEMAGVNLAVSAKGAKAQ